MTNTKKKHYHYSIADVITHCATNEELDIALAEALKLDASSDTKRKWQKLVAKKRVNTSSIITL